MTTTNHTSPSGEVSVAYPRYIVIGYGETDLPQATFVNEADKLLDAVLGMMYMSPSDADAEIREAYRRDLDDPDEWSHGHWHTEFEIGGITIYDLGEPVHQGDSDKPIGEDAANGAIGEREAFEWPPMPELPMQYACHGFAPMFTEHQMQGYANAYGEAVRAALAAPVAPAVDAQPVAWRHKATKILRNDSIAKGADFEPADWEPLYTAAQSEGLRKDACGKSAGNFLNCAPEGDKPHYLPVDEEYKENPDVVELFFDAARLNTKPERRMTDDDLMRLARKHEGTDPSDDIPQVFALTPLELSALAKDIRRVALEEAADLVESIREQIRDKSIIGFKAWAMGVGVLENASSHIRALSQKGPQ